MKGCRKSGFLRRKKSQEQTGPQDRKRYGAQMSTKDADCSSNEPGRKRIGDTITVY